MQLRDSAVVVSKTDRWQEVLERNVQLDQGLTLCRRRRGVPYVRVLLVGQTPGDDVFQDVLQQWVEARQDPLLLALLTTAVLHREHTHDLTNVTSAVCAC